MHSRIWVGSATTACEPSARPVRRCAQDRFGITISEAMAGPVPSGDASGCPPENSVRTDATATDTTGREERERHQPQPPPPEPECYRAMLTTATVPGRRARGTRDRVPLAGRTQYQPADCDWDQAPHGEP